MTKFALSFMAGIAAFNFFPFFPVSISTSCTVAAFFLLFRRKAEKGKIYSVMFIFFFGLFYCSVRQDPFPELSLPDHDISIAGTIIDVPEVSDEKIRFTLDNVYLEERKVEGKIRLVALRNLFNENRIEDILVPGFVISAVAKLKEPHTFQNP